METAFIVFGKDDIVLILADLAPKGEFNKASLADAIEGLESRAVVRATREAKVMGL
jgi:hypothetical protein